MFNRQAADSDGGGGAAVRLSAPLSRALRVWVFFLSLSLCRRRSRVAGFQRWQATLFSAMSSWWLLHLVTASTTFYFTMSLFFCSFLNAKVQQPCTSNKDIFQIFCICFDTSIWERAHWKMFPFEKLTACPVVH